MGCNQGGLPLSGVKGREVTTDTVLLASAASKQAGYLIMDLGTGTGSVLSLYTGKASVKIGIDSSREALSSFDRSAGFGVLCSVENVARLFRGECADIVTANPPYNVSGSGRGSPDPLRRQAREGDPLLYFRFIFAGRHLLRPGGVLIMSGRSSHVQTVTQGMRAAGFHGIRFEEEKGVFLFFGSVPYTGVAKDSRGVPGSI
jgi:tRNA1(Val) A37 N6-methylase TrmN6